MASNPIWLDAFDEKGKFWSVELTYDLPGELEEAGLALEVSDPVLANRLFGLAYRLRHAPAETSCSRRMRPGAYSPGAAQSWHNKPTPP